MKDNTPAREIRDKDLEANLEAFRGCLGRIVSEIEEGDLHFNILDIRLGKGGWALEILHRFPTSYLEGYEPDKETFEIAEKRIRELQPNDSVEHGLYNYPFDPGDPTFGEESSLPFWDILLADFNVLTLLKPGPLFEAIRFAGSPKWVIFTDVAISKLHLNYRSYGLRKPSLESYWLAWARRFYSVDLRYDLIDYKKEHFAASTAVFRNWSEREEVED